VKERYKWETYYIHIPTHRYTHTHIYTPTYVHTHIYTPTYVHTHIYTHIHTHTYIYNMFSKVGLLEETEEEKRKRMIVSG
jgi:hypothetical protein